MIKVPKLQGKIESDSVWMLVDNGSLCRWGVLNLRCVAYGLSTEMGCEVFPVSVDFSDRVPLEELNNEPAWVLEPFIREHYALGKRTFILMPFMFAEGGGIAAIMLRKIKQLRSELTDLQIHVLPFLFDETHPDNLQVARIVAQRVREISLREGLVQPAVVLVDHGSPRVQAAYVRNVICGQVSALLEGEVKAIGAASMERREGDAYAFNDPLLAERLRQPPFHQGDVVIALLFLSPGRHAGEEGDIAQICIHARAEQPELRTWMTDLVGTHPDLIPWMESRCRQWIETYA